MRRVGIELEFAGLTEERAAQITARLLGGVVRQPDSTDFLVKNSAIGDIEIYLDMRFRKDMGSDFGQRLLDVSRIVVPIEAVTQPLALEDLPKVDELRDALRRAGALGSRNGVLYGFGLHLNPEVVSLEARDLYPVLRAFALLEPWLRRFDPMDVSRRLLPFTAPYPPAFVDILASQSEMGLDGIFEHYLAYNATRNRGLDMIPILAQIDRDRVASVLGSMEGISARPTFHYRLPDCRINEPDWSVAYEWNRWVLVERLAASDDLDALADAWGAFRREMFGVTSDWVGTVTEFLTDRGYL